MIYFQDQLTNWGPGTCKEEIDQLLSPVDHSKKNGKSPSRNNSHKLEHSDTGENGDTKAAANDSYSPLHKTLPVESVVPVDTVFSDGDKANNLLQSMHLCDTSSAPAHTSSVSVIEPHEPVGREDELTSDFTSSLSLDEAMAQKERAHTTPQTQSCDENMQHNTLDRPGLPIS